MRIQIVDSAFDPAAELATFNAGHGKAGAMASFVGYCRDASRGHAVKSLYIEQYPGFTEKEIARLAGEAGQTSRTLDLLVVHRVGSIRPGEAIVLVAALAAHRSDAFDAVRLLMDYLKTDAPLWKKEIGPDGEHWVEPTAHDHARRAMAEEKT